MCGIFGSTNKERFFSLYYLNKERGDFSIGVFSLKGEIYDILKQERPLKFFDLFDNFYYYAGHTRAPTGNIRKFDFWVCHPLRYGDWYIMHNGILGNFENLRKKYKLPLENFKIDSSIIPYLLSKNKGISWALEQLEGIFGIWGYNVKSKEMFLARCASTIWLYRGDFSSVKFSGAKLIPEGKVFVYNYKKREFEEKGEFKYNSPYFVS